MDYLVYIAETRKDGSSYHRTKKRCQTLTEAKQTQEQLMKKTGKFHEIKEEKINKSSY